MWGKCEETRTTLVLWSATKVSFQFFLFESVHFLTNETVTVGYFPGLTTEGACSLLP